jgi:uncharacterized coiled-coil protein SlyX
MRRPLASLDPDRVREHLAELEHRRTVQEHIVERLDELLDDERRELAAITDTITNLRRHPMVAAALEKDTE